MKPLLFSLFTSDAFLAAFKSSGQYDIGDLIFREFPDGESYIKFNTEVKNRDLIFIVAMDKPNAKFLPLIFALQTARELGASRIGLIVPYLPYMRQDKSFSTGEAVTSKYFSKLVSMSADWLLTIDPHLHRYHSLNEIYTIPSTVLHPTEPISNWIQQNVNAPIIIGPDSESEQWVSLIAKRINAPIVVLDKIRIGDNKVEIKFPDFKNYANFTPVLVDDIISTGATMIKSIHHLKSINMPSPVCVGVHAVFANQVFDNLLNAGVKTVVSCNSIEHISNAIDVSQLINNWIARGA